MSQSINDSFKKIHSLFSDLTQQLTDFPKSKPALVSLFSEIIQVESQIKNELKNLAKQPAVKSSADISMYQQAKSILLESNLENLLNFSVDALIQITKADRGFLAVLNPSGGFDLYVARSIGSREIEDPNSKISKTILKETLSEGKLKSVNLDQLDPSQYLSIQSLNIGSVLSFPIEFQGKHIAILYLDKDENQPPFEASHNRELLEFCQMLAPKINQLKQVAEMEELNSSKKEEPFRFEGFVGQSQVFNDVIKLTARVSKTEVNVLVLGESGTGKELIAQGIHQNSIRKKGPFVAVNCSAIPEDLIESELFGYEKGAFTGANQRKPGKFELANEGTIFLDEIGDLNFELQSKLLRVIQDRKLDILGGKQPFPLNVRVIAATNRNLKSMTETRQFREDLYYRLNVFSVNLPPLRGRRVDIPLLSKYLLEKIAGKMQRASYSIDDKALNALIDYEWPGNIRELENVLERAVILCENDVIKLKDLPPEIIEEVDVDAATEMNFDEMVEAYKRELIQKALAKANGNKSKAAKILGISRNYFHQWLNR